MSARPAYAPADNAALRHADFRDFSKALISSAELRDRILVARGLPPLGMPHINDNVKRGVSKACGPERRCADCGSALNERRNTTGRCIHCVRAFLHPNTKRCSVCKVGLDRKNASGLCAEHRIRIREAKLDTPTRALIAKVARLMKVKAEDVLSRSHETAPVEARCVVATVMRRRGQSLQLIGRRLGRDHSSIKHLIDNFPKYAARNPLVAETLEKLA
jgi:hypothetical protein